jgi:hypothetical protein
VIIAGVMLAAIAIPGQLATARLAGMPPETGLHAFAAGSLVFAAFGANRFMSVAADSTIAPIFAGGVASIAAMGKRETQIILKTEERNLLLEVGRDGKFVTKTVGWGENRVSLEGGKLEVAVVNGRRVRTRLPAAPKQAVRRCCTTSPDE